MVTIYKELNFEFFISHFVFETIRFFHIKMVHDFYQTRIMMDNQKTVEKKYLIHAVMGVLMANLLLTLIRKQGWCDSAW